MNALPLYWPHPPGPRVPWLLLAAVAGAVLDLAMAVLFWAGEGVAPIRIPQSIAAWFLGAAAYRGGPGTALLGVVAYVLLAWAMARACSAASPTCCRGGSIRGCRRCAGFCASCS